MPWMFSSTLALVPYLLGWLGFLVAFARGSLAAIARSWPARATFSLAYAGAVLITTGDLLYLTELAASVDASWSGLEPVPARLIGPDGRLPVRSAGVYPPPEKIDAVIATFWWSVVILVAALVTTLGSRALERRQAEPGEPRRRRVPELATLGAAGLACIALRFIL